MQTETFAIFSKVKVPSVFLGGGDDGFDRRKTGGYGLASDEVKLAGSDDPDGQKLMNTTKQQLVIDNNKRLIGGYFMYKIYRISRNV